jgi:hypothetical protein
VELVDNVWGNQKMKRANVATIICVMAVLGGLVTLAEAMPVIDGRFDPSEGYSEGYYVNLSVEGVGKIADQGQLWYYQDGTTKDLYVAFFQPLTLVDNTYGKNSIGWGSAAPSGKSHKFGDLVGSDKAQFTITDGSGKVVLDFMLDYITASKKAPSGYASLGVTGGEGKVISGSAASLIDWGTSLDYNFNTLGHVLTQNSPATDAAYTPNPQFPGWVFEVTYEFQVKGSVFGNKGFGSLAIPLIHDSPNKIGKNLVWDEIDGKVPEPATICMLGLGGLAFLSRRRTA